MPPTESCPICSTPVGNLRHRAREMMFGLEGTFEYVECGGCGCLRIVEIPPDLAAYYPEGYYSLGAREVAMPGRAQRTLRRLRTSLMLSPRNSAFRRLALGHRPPPEWLGWLRGHAATSSAILDFGCGSGKLLLQLQRQGFRHLAGFDPYLEHDIVYPGGLVIRRCIQPDWASRFDLVMLHHSFEHVAEPEQALAGVRELLAPGGFVLLRTPLADSVAWRTYGTDWVQLDAPRHLFVHTRASIRLLAGRSGFRTVTIQCDSRAFQFWGSEQYRHGITLRDARSHAENPAGSMFSEDEISEFERRARQLNEQGEGDQAVFLLQAVS